jgi:hypothetical protein
MGDGETPETFEEGCGYSFDHDTLETYRGADGVGWECRRCGTEGWEPADDTHQVAAPRDAVDDAEFAEFNQELRSAREGER